MKPIFSNGYKIKLHNRFHQCAQSQAIWQILALTLANHHSLQLNIIISRRSALDFVSVFIAEDQSCALKLSSLPRSVWYCDLLKPRTSDFHSLLKISLWNSCSFLNINLALWYCVLCGGSALDLISSSLRRNNLFWYSLLKISLLSITCISISPF